jgi:hypothetical protein
MKKEEIDKLVKLSADVIRAERTLEMLESNVISIEIRLSVKEHGSHDIPMKMIPNLTSGILQHLQMDFEELALDLREKFDSLKLCKERNGTTFEPTEI